MTNQTTQEQTYHVILRSNRYVSPFPDLQFLTREEAQAFCDSPEAGEWQGKLAIQGPRIESGR